MNIVNVIYKTCDLYPNVLKVWIELWCPNILVVNVLDHRVAPKFSHLVFLLMPQRSLGFELSLFCCSYLLSRLKLCFMLLNFSINCEYCMRIVNYWNVNWNGMVVQAQDFRQQGTQLRRKMWYQKMKIKLIVLAIIIALILIIVLSVCHGFSC